MDIKIRNKFIEIKNSISDWLCGVFSWCGCLFLFIFFSPRFLEWESSFPEFCLLVPFYCICNK